MLRHSLLLGAAITALASASQAQPRGGGRDDLLDALTRHIQICGEIGDAQSRLGCYDKLQTQVGGVLGNVAPAPTPLRPGTPSTVMAQPPQPGRGTPLPPLTTPGGGIATLGTTPSMQGGTLEPPDPDRAFDPTSATSGYRPPEGMMPKPQPVVRRTGARAIPSSSRQQSLVSLAANNLTYGDSRYWQVTVVVTSNTPRSLDTQVQCTFLNAGRAVGDAYFGPILIAPGEQVSTELIGPPTTVYVDTTNCRVLSP